MGFLVNHIGSFANQIESLQQKQVFSSKIIYAQEEERRRVVREIHDGPAQTMANIVFRAEVCERLIDTDMQRAKNELKELREQVREVLKETRKIIFDLRPMTIDDLGLIPTIKRIVDTLEQRSDVDAEVIVLGVEKRLDAHVEIGLFRIIQEAITNIEKHAKASKAWIRIDFRPKLISVIIEDNGQGFTPKNENNGQSFGLMGMKERVNLLNGELEISSDQGKGTKIYIKVKLKPE